MNMPGDQLIERVGDPDKGFFKFVIANASGPEQGPVGQGLIPLLQNVGPQIYPSCQDASGDIRN